MEYDGRVVDTKGLTKLLAAESISSLVASATGFAFPILAIETLQFTSTEVGVLRAFSLSAPLLFGLSAGAVADGSQKKSLMAWCFVARTIFILMVPIFLFFGLLNFYSFCVLSILIASTKLFFDSAVVATVPIYSSGNSVSKVYAWYEGLGSAARAVGTLVSSFFLHLSKLSYLFLFCAASCFTAIFFLQEVKVVDQTVVLEKKSNHFDEILQGIRLLWANKVQRILGISGGLFNFFHSAFFTVFLIYALKQLLLDVVSLGSIFSAIGILGVISAALAPYLIRKIGFRFALMFSLILVGPVGVPILFAHKVHEPYQIILIATCFVLWDFVILLNIIAEQSVRQMLVPKTHLARFAATTRFISWGADPLGAVFGGTLSDLVFGTVGTLAFCLIGMSFAGLFPLFCDSIRDNKFLPVER